MATLAGQKIKDKYGNLLHVEGGLTTTAKVVEDGQGVDSPLKLSTTEVEVDGVLTFTSAPTTDGSELTALLIDGNNNVVKRELDATAFTGGGGGSTTFANPMFVLRPLSTYNLTTTATTPSIAAVSANSNSGSYLFNDSTNSHLQTSSTTTGAMTIQAEGVVRIEISFFFEITTNNTNVVIDIFEKPSGSSESLIQSITRTQATSANAGIGFSLFRHVAAGTDIYFKISQSAGAGSLLTTSTFAVTKLD